MAALPKVSGTSMSPNETDRRDILRADRAEASAPGVSGFFTRLYRSHRARRVLPLALGARFLG
jgi:hypothetical protein